MERFEDLITSNIPVLVDFFAEWCGPCKAMKPILEELKGIKGEKVRIVKVDVDKHKEIAAYYQIQSVPTLMIFKDGKQLWRQSGVMRATTILSSPFLPATTFPKLKEGRFRQSRMVILIKNTPCTKIFCYYTM